MLEAEEESTHREGQAAAVAITVAAAVAADATVAVAAVAQVMPIQCQLRQPHIHWHPVLLQAVSRLFGPLELRRLHVPLR